AAGTVADLTQGAIHHGEFMDLFWLLLVALALGAALLLHEHWTWRGIGLRQALAYAVRKDVGRGRLLPGSWSSSFRLLPRARSSRAGPPGACAGTGSGAAHSGVERSGPGTSR